MRPAEDPGEEGRSGGSGPVPAPGRVLRLDLTFDGARLVGWQRQDAGRSVQGVLEEALGRLLGAPHAVVGCGRTDAGVHARRFTASARTASALPAARIQRGLDALLPDDVGVRRVRDAAPDFHALRDARWKWYRYTLLVAGGRRPLEEGRTWRRPRLPALDALRRAAEPLVGRHDFAAFANSGSPRRGTVRTLWAASFSRAGARVRFDVVGDGFLYRMVRSLVGTLLAAAEAPDPGAAVRAVLAGRDRTRAGATAPARGLTLMDVGYGDDPPPLPGDGLPRVPSRA